MTQNYLDYAGVAEKVNLTSSTVRSYWSRGYMPEPDVMVGNRPGWTEETIDRWSGSRLGAGYRSDIVRKL